MSLRHPVLGILVKILYRCIDIRVYMYRYIFLYRYGYVRARERDSRCVYIHRERGRD